MMAENVERTCAQHVDRADCPDCLIEYWPKQQSYGILVHDGGSSMIKIQFCPWCGTELPRPSAEADAL